jgi:pimeloyl-ACP methyl ester carboxylesterase
LLTRPAVVRYFLERTWGSHEIDEPMWRQAVACAHQPGALHAPLYFLSGELFSADIHGIYEGLRQPVWMSHGVRGDFTDYRGAAIVAQRPNWQLTTFGTGALPYFEEPAKFLAAFDRFLASPRPGADSPVPRTQWGDVARLQP